MSDKTERNPEQCGYSVNMGGIYICSMSVLPCKACRICAREQMETWRMDEILQKKVKE